MSESKPEYTAIIWLTNIFFTFRASCWYKSLKILGFLFVHLHHQAWVHELADVHGSCCMCAVSLGGFVMHLLNNKNMAQYSTSFIISVTSRQVQMKQSRKKDTTVYTDNNQIRYIKKS